MDGIINVYKEKGFTSFDVVAKLRGILKQKKIGHTGTLDPDAVGVLPVCVGKATKVCDLLTNRDKIYEAVLRLGVSTDTEDLTGTVLETKEVTCTEEEITKAILSFEGEYEQIPPMYSALKINGKRLYELAREGKTVERKARKIEIYAIEILAFDLPEVTIRIQCSKGTYIRSLCRDIGEKLGCLGCMAALKRVQVGQFLLESAHTLSEIEEIVKEGNLSDLLMPVDGVFEDYEAVYAKEQYAKLLYNGNPLETKMIANEIQLKADHLYRVYDQKDTFVGVFQWVEEKNVLKPKKMFL